MDEPTCSEADHAAVEFRDGLTTRTTVIMSWRDRLRILFTGRLTLTTHTQTKNVIGATKDEPAHVYVHPLIRPRRLAEGYGEVESDTGHDELRAP